MLYLIKHMLMAGNNFISIMFGNFKKTSKISGYTHFEMKLMLVKIGILDQIETS